MIGRSEELSRFDALLDALKGGDGACLAIEGEPGIGKSRLLAELCRRADDRGHLVLEGAAAEFERDLPYAVWVEALDAYVASQQFDDERLLSDLAVALPSLRGEIPAGDARHRVHRAMRRLLGTLAERGPVVLALDDLHWSDPASIDLLNSLARRGVPPGVLLALGYRTGRLAHDLTAALAAAYVPVVELTALSEADCRELAAELTPTRQAAVFRESGGNPFYALQLAGAARAPERSTSADRLASDSEVPRPVAAALLEELEALSPVARRLLDAGSIAGDPLEPELAFAIAELSPDNGLAALDELLAVRLLLPTAVPRRFAFRHPLVRRAVYESAGAGWRMAAHGRASAALATRGAAAVTRAHHVEQSAVAGDADAVALLLEAAAATAPRAPAAAVRWFEAALRLQSEADRAGRLATLIALALVLRSTGDLEACAARLDEALALTPRDDVKSRVRLIAAAASAEHFLGRHDQANRRLDTALDALEDRGSEVALTVLFARIAGAFFSLDVAEGCALGVEALAIAQRLGDPLLVGASAAALAHAHANAGDVPAARTAIDLAAARLDAAGDDALAPHIEALNRLAWAEHLIERDTDAVRHALRGIAIARATGQDQFVPMLTGAQALSMLRQGQVSAALALQVGALETAKVAANDYVTCWVLSTTAHIAIARGDREDARRDAEQAVALVEGQAGRIPTVARARLAMIGERPPDVEALIEAIPPSWGAPYAAGIARAELLEGRIEPAERWLVRAEAAARRIDLPWATAITQRGRAELLLAQGNATAAAALALESADGAHRAPIAKARSQVLAGQALSRAGRREEAVRVLREAEHGLDALGIDHDRDLARRELRRLNARAEPRGPSARGESGLAALSTREREVAELVTARHTNREIAALLFLSEKTIESHLRNIFAKLGASSRVDVARAVERGV